MIGKRKSKWFKLISVVLIFLFLYQVEYVLGLDTGPDILKQYKEAKEAFLKGKKDKSNYKTAKQILERLTLCLGDNNKGQKQLLGKVYLLLAAANEILKDTKNAKKFYQRAKSILTTTDKPKVEEDKRIIKKEKDIAGNPIEGIELSHLKYYRRYYLGKKPFPVLWVAGGVVIVVVLVCLLGFCKSKKELTVNLGVGVEGNPASGTYKYKKGTIVNYEYTTAQGYDDLNVLLDGNPVSPSGTITMDNSHTLNASTTKLVSVHMESNISGAELYVDSQNQGVSTPCDFFVTAGNHEIQLVKSNCGEAKTTINFEENINYNISVNLAGYTYDFVNKWGSYGRSEGEFRLPRGIAIDKNNYVYVVDGDNNRIQKFDFNGVFKHKWGSEGTGDGQFRGPTGIACDQDNYVYVIEADNNRIQKFDSYGIFITRWGSFGSGNGEFDWPDNIAVDKNNYVYIADSGNNRIQIFDSNRNFITQWGSYGTGSGQFNYPNGIAVDENNYVYIGDQKNSRVQKFDSNGTFITQWGGNGADNGQFEWALGIAVDKNNYLYVSTYHRIQKFDPNGNFITKWGSYGTNNGQFDGPDYIAVGENGMVFISDWNNNRIQKFRMSDTTEGDGEWQINTTGNSSLSRDKTRVKPQPEPWKKKRKQEG